VQEGRVGGAAQESHRGVGLVAGAADGVEALVAGPHLARLQVEVARQQLAAEDLEELPRGQPAAGCERLVRRGPPPFRRRESLQESPHDLDEVGVDDRRAVEAARCPLRQRGLRRR
jgi:hypothetical protein